MELIDINGRWKEQKAKLKRRFVKLQDSDSIFEEGKREEMITKLEIKLGKTRDELLRDCLNLQNIKIIH